MTFPIDGMLKFSLTCLDCEYDSSCMLELFLRNKLVRDEGLLCTPMNVHDVLSSQQQKQLR